MKLKLLLLLTLFGLNAFSQETPGFAIPNYAPKSPEAAAFLKSGEYPVDLSTGVPSISVPLYVIESKGLSIPISLDYHASGIRVSQEASWVGLGWNLNYGAQIILNVADEVDEGNGAIDQIPSDASIAYYNSHPYDFDQGPQVSEQFDKSRVKDIYIFSSPTANGQFYIRNRSTNDVVVYPPEAFKVDMIGGYAEGIPGGTGFRVVDPQGNTYIFGTKEQSIQPHPGDTDINYTSAWYVSEIQTSSNDTIQFNYENDGTLVETSRSQKIDIINSVEKCGCTAPEGYRITNTIGTIVSQSSSTNTYSKKIREIIFNGGNSKVMFDKQTGRQDLINGNSSLQMLKIVHKNSLTQEFELVRGYSFVYSYFNQGQTGSLLYLKKRLKLDRVETLLEGDAHSFIYSDIVLPSKDSYAQDAYGYYNGANNLSLIPTTVVTSPYPVTIGNAYRGVNEGNAKAGILTEVHYPSKGYTKFNFESNRCYGSSTETIAFSPSAASGTYHTDFIYEPNIYYDTLDFTDNFTLNGPTTGIISWNAFNNAGAQYSQIITHAYQTNSQYVRFTITKHNTDGTYTVVYDSGNQDGGASSSSAEAVESFTDDLTLSAGSYIITVACYGRNVRMNGQFTYIDSITTNDNFLTAGLRVASIENYDSDNTLLTKKNYEYTMPDDPAKSSGKWINDPYKGYWNRESRNYYDLGLCPLSSQVAVGMFPYVSYTVINTLSSNSIGIGQNSIIYEYVREKNVSVTDQTANGYILYKFLWDTDFVLDPSIHISQPWKRGKLKEKTFYKNGLTTFLRKEVNSYLEDQSKSSQIVGFKRIRSSNVSGLNADNIDWYSSQVSQCTLPSSFAQANIIFKYDIDIYWEYLKSNEITENFFDEQNQLTGTLTRTTTYNYNNPNHLQLSSEVTTSSTGETIEKKYYYPGDALVSTEPVVNTLIEKNMVATPLITQTFRNGSKLAEQKSLYKNWGNSIIMPEFMQASKGANTPETRIRFTQVDNTNGNILELQMEGGTKISYIYGYNNTQPVAKIENKAYASIPAGLITAIKTATDTGNDLAVKNALSALRNDASMANAMVTTFTYKPLIGISSITDPKGYTTFYEYDNLGRLIYIRDKDNNILSESKYHYKQ